MKSWTNLFRVIFLIIGVVVLMVNAQLYNLCDQQRMAINTLANEQKVDAQVSSNKLKDEQRRIDSLSTDLQEARQQIKDQNDTLSDQKDALSAQKDALLQEVEKRQQMANQNKGILTTLVDIKAEADAIKQDMKGWQKDYVSVLADLDKKMDNSQDELKGLEDNLVALNIPELRESIQSLKADVEKITHPPDNSLPSASPAPEKKIERTELESQ